MVVKCSVCWVLVASSFYIAAAKAQGGVVDSELFQILCNNNPACGAKTNQPGDIDDQLFELLNPNNAVNNRPEGPPRPAANNCQDRHQECPGWAERGECLDNIDYMAPHCKRSCGYCEKEDTECKNNNDYCVAWSIRGQCLENPDYMKDNCKSACNACGTNTLPEDLRRYEPIPPASDGIVISPPGPPS